MLRCLGVPSMRRRMSPNCRHALLDTSTLSDIVGAGTTRPGGGAGGSAAGGSGSGDAWPTSKDDATGRPGPERGEGTPRRQDPAVDVSTPTFPGVDVSI